MQPPQIPSEKPGKPASAPAGRQSPPGGCPQPLPRWRFRLPPRDPGTPRRRHSPRALSPSWVSQNPRFPQY
jgi:hypothetical protein